MSSLARVLAILDLFTEAHPLWHADAIAAALNYTRPTAYRYIKGLVEAGYLQKATAGHYTLGARFIEFDYLLCNSDPVLLAAAPVMEDLTLRSGLDTVLTAMFRDRVIDTYRVHAKPSLKLAYGRGRPRPLFQGAAPKIILAHLARTQAARIYKAHAVEIATLGLGSSWLDFRDQLTQWRRKGDYVSFEEVEPGVCAMATPVLNPNGEVVAALALVWSPDSHDTVSLAPLRASLVEACGRIGTRLAAAAGS
jgi:DNA-binding IclR family transcriptional regulator